MEVLTLANLGFIRATLFKDGFFIFNSDEPTEDCDLAGRPLPHTQ